MGFFDKLFGKKRAAAAPSPTATPSEGASSGPDRIKVYDQFGRELWLTRQQWVDSVLLPNMEQAWNDPDQLAGFLINGLQDGFASELLKGSERLAGIDTKPDRGAVLHSIALLKSGRIDDSERVLKAHIARHGETGTVLTNLAKVYAERNDTPRMMETLWRGLELDPNLDNAVPWYEVLHRDKDGEPAGIEALRRIAALPGSWRAQLWLARAALQEGDLPGALALYAESLSRTQKPVPTDVLMQMSGDLGNQGHLPELVNLTAPHFQAEVHGVTVGNNLIKGYLDLGHLDQAKGILDQLHAQKRPDWKETLGFWDTELAKARLTIEEVPSPARMRVTLLTVEGPVWLKPDSPAIELFPARAGAGPTVCLVGGTVKQATNSKRAEHQLSDAQGRLSRALPLYLAEQLHWHTNARVSTLVPWVVGPPGGFLVSGTPWDSAEVAALARRGDQPHDYAVTVHLEVQSEPWQAELRLIRTIDGACLHTLSTVFTPTSLESELSTLARQMIQRVQQEAGAITQPCPAAYAAPVDQGFTDYLLRLEQLLAVRCSAMEGVQSGFLSGEREILDGNLQLCLSHPESVSLRLLLAQTLLTMKRASPAAVSEFQEKTRLLQDRHPLPGAAQGVIDRILRDAHPS